MWLVIKYKTNQINFLINNLKETIGELPEMCIPKIKSRNQNSKKIQTYFYWKIISFVITKNFQKIQHYFNLSI